MPGIATKAHCLANAEESRFCFVRWIYLVATHVIPSKRWPPMVIDAYKDRSFLALKRLK